MRGSKHEVSKKELIFAWVKYGPTFSIENKATHCPIHCPTRPCAQDHLTLFHIGCRECVAKFPCMTRGAKL